MIFGRHNAGSGLIKAITAGLLAVLLIVSATLSVSHGLHRALHSDSSHHCLICGLAKGQVAAADAGQVAAIVVLLFVFSVPLLRSILSESADRRLAPSRGPPCFPSHS